MTTEEVLVNILEDTVRRKSNPKNLEENNAETAEFFNALRTLLGIERKQR